MGFQEKNTDGYKARFRTGFPGEPRSPKIILCANTDWYLFNFRLDLAVRLQDAGWEVVLASPAGAYTRELRQKGFRWIELDARPRGLDPMESLLLMLELRSIFMRERPDLIHAFTVRHGLLAGIAAKLAGVRYVVAIAGLGHLFTSSAHSVRMLRPGVLRAYKWALEGVGSHVVFQNESDREQFVGKTRITMERTTVIRGSGVDCVRFSCRRDRPPRHENQTLRCLFASRLLRDKGIFLALRALELVRHQGHDATLTIAGQIYPDNPSSLSEGEVVEIARREGVRFVGVCDDIPKLMEEHDLILLPTRYGEGTPRVLIEGAAMKMPLIASDIPACRGLVQQGRNGYLVPPDRTDALVDAITWYLHNPDAIALHGEESRKIALAGFSEELVNTRTIDLYEALLVGRQSGDKEPYARMEGMR